MRQNRGITLTRVSAKSCPSLRPAAMSFATARRFSFADRFTTWFGLEVPNGEQTSQDHQSSALPIHAIQGISSWTVRSSFHSQSHPAAANYLRPVTAAPTHPCRWHYKTSTCGLPTCRCSCKANITASLGRVSLFLVSREWEAAVPGRAFLFCLHPSVAAPCV